MKGKERDLGIVWGIMKKGERNEIKDVKGVKVGNKKLRDGNINKGVKEIIKNGGNIYRRKVMDEWDIINGLGKRNGLVKIEEMG